MRVCVFNLKRLLPFFGLNDHKNLYITMEPYDTAFVPSPKGFRNIGAICWMNSLMQSLLSCPTFMKTVIRNRESLTQNELGKILYELVDDAVSGNDTSQYTCMMRNVLMQRKHFATRQECAHEGFHMIMDLLSNDAIAEVFLHRVRYYLACSSCKKSRVCENRSNFIINLTHYAKNDDFMEALRMRSSDTEVKCECGEMMKQIDILTMVPEIVVVAFEKFYNKKDLYFPQTFDITDKSGKKMIFKQVAQIEHSGSMNGGHYVARCLRDNIYQFNDLSVSPSSLTPTPNTYMVFYAFDKVV